MPEPSSSPFVRKNSRIPPSSYVPAAKLRYNPTPKELLTHINSAAMTKEVKQQILQSLKEMHQDSESSSSSSGGSSSESSSESSDLDSTDSEATRKAPDDNGPDRPITPGADLDCPSPATEERLLAENPDEEGKRPPKVSFKDVVAPLPRDDFATPPHGLKERVATNKNVAAPGVINEPVGVVKTPQ